LPQTMEHGAHHGTDDTAPEDPSLPPGRFRNRIPVRFKEDVLAAEEPLEIRVGGRSFAVTMRTPGDDLT
jgi:formate dehydrogenase assembly factor FdhD